MPIDHLLREARIRFFRHYLMKKARIRFLGHHLMKKACGCHLGRLDSQMLMYLTGFLLEL